VDTDILRVQRNLRQRLFEGPAAIRWRPGRELGAELLLYLDDPQACWRIATDWLRGTLDADRVDGGFGGFVGASGRPRDYVVMAESQRGSQPLPAALGLRFSAADPGLRGVWCEAGATAMLNVSQERSLTHELRGTLRSLGTAAKLALPVRDGLLPIGLICADWHTEAPRWDTEVCNQLGGLARDVIGPVLAAASFLARERELDRLPCNAEPAVTDTDAAADLPTSSTVPPAELASLTPAERKVARLVALGLSYKEVARQLGRSASTVDHQLRSIRDKLGMRSTARLVHLLSEHAALISH
jgi:DNA-binding CsgD family transcriptional regulator